MFRRPFMLLIAALLVGCANAPPKLPQGSTFTVVSLLGDSLKLQQVGITVFGNSAKSIDVSSWAVGKHVEDAATKTLLSAGQNARMAPMGSAADIGQWSYTNFTSSYSFAGGSVGLQKVANAAHADYLILVAQMPSNFTDPFFRTNQPITGFGIYQRRGAESITFADVGMILIDGKTGEVIDRRRAYESSARPDSLWLDIENTQPQISELGQPPEASFAVLDAAVKKGLSFLGLVMR